MPNKTNNYTNIVLIGMPGSGKSTVGSRLARQLNMAFVDTDQLLEKAENKFIQDIVNRRGVRHFRQLEESVLTKLRVRNTVISTGGSAVYSHAAMQHLGATGLRVYLQISLATLSRRVTNTGSRGLVKHAAHPLARLYKERIDLYENVADVVFNNNQPLTGLRFAELVASIQSQL